MQIIYKKKNMIFFKKKNLKKTKKWKKYNEI